MARRWLAAGDGRMRVRDVLWLTDSGDAHIDTNEYGFLRETIQSHSQLLYTLLRAIGVMPLADVEEERDAEGNRR
jgi:hypothetical protein